MARCVICGAEFAWLSKTSYATKYIEGVGFVCHYCLVHPQFPELREAYQKQQEER